MVQRPVDLQQCGSMMSNRAKKILFHFISYLAGIGILVLLITCTGWEQFLDVLSRISVWWLSLSVLVYACSWVFRVWRLERLVLRFINGIDVFELFKLNVSGFALNIMLPAKLGDAATVGFLRMLGVKLGNAVAIIVQTRILDLLALVLLSSPCMLLLSKRGIPNWLSLTLLLCTLLIALSYVIVFAGKNGKFESLLKSLLDKFQQVYLQLVVSKVRDAYQSYLEIVSDKKLMMVCIILSIAVWIFEALTCQVIALSIDPKIRFLPVLIAVSVANIGKSIPATPGSIGIYESIMVVVLVLFDVPAEVALVLAVLDQMVKKSFNLLFGLPATTNLGISVSQLLSQYRNSQVSS